MTRVVIGEDIRIQVRCKPEERERLRELMLKCGFASLSEFMRVAAWEKVRKELGEYPDRDC